MGFRKNIGATFPCRIKDGYLEVDYPVPVKFQTGIPEEIDWQCNYFTGSQVFWVLITDDYVYTGYRDGTVMKTLHDATIIAGYTWDYQETSYTTVGWSNNGGDVQELQQDEGCDRLLHRVYSRSTFILDKDVNIYVPDPEDEDDIALSVLYSHMISHMEKSTINILEKGGDMLDAEKHGHWRTDPDIRTVPALQYR